MDGKTMSFKSIINNLAKKNNVAAQSVLQTYMLERLLERISISKYKDNFILKGGMLISAMLGIDSRTTMDMDTTIKGFALTEENVKNILTEICNIQIEDNVELQLKRVSLIRETDDYGGYRATFEAKFNNEVPVIMKIDITTGDKITYREIEYSFDLMLEDRKIKIWSYNVETLVAEKFETIISRNIATTRMRDYYDVYMLMNTQRKNIDDKVLRDAIISTADHRETTEKIENCEKIIEVIKNDEHLKFLWERYKKDNFYAQEIEYSELMNAITKVGQIYMNK